MYKSQKAKTMRNVATTIVLAFGFVAFLNIMEFIFMILPVLPILLASVLMLYIVMQVLQGLGVLEYDLSKLRK